MDTIAQQIQETKNNINSLNEQMSQQLNQLNSLNYQFMSIYVQQTGSFPN